MALIITSLAIKGTVVAVASSAKHEFSKPIKESIKLLEDHGVEGDAHAGRFMQHRYLAKQIPAMRNIRQVHLLASELFAELTSGGFTVAPGDLGENVTTRGLDLTKIPLGDALADREFSCCRAHRPSDTVLPDRPVSEGIETRDDLEARTAAVQVRRAWRGEGNWTHCARRSHKC